MTLKLFSFAANRVNLHEITSQPILLPLRPAPKAMKTKLASLFAILPLVTAAHGASVLLGGYYGLNESGAALQSAAPGVSNISVTLARSGVSTDITQGYSQINNANWGNTTLDVAAPTIGNGDDLRNAIFQGASPNANDQILTLTITNNGTQDLVLDSMHWWLKKDINNQGPNLQSLTYSTGDLADANGTSTGSFALANGIVGYDIALSSFLTDTTLAASESASFTWTHGAAQDALGNTAIRMDNFAISGTVIPEPSAALLGALGLLMFLRRRR